MTLHPFRRDRVIYSSLTGLRHYLGENAVTTLACGASTVGSSTFFTIKERVHATCLLCVASSS